MRIREAYRAFPEGSPRERDAVDSGGRTTLAEAAEEFDVDLDEL